MTVELTHWLKNVEEPGTLGLVPILRQYFVLGEEELAKTSWWLLKVVGGQVGWGGYQAVFETKETNRFWVIYTLDLPPHSATVTQKGWHRDSGAWK